MQGYGLKSNTAVVSLEIWITPDLRSLYDVATCLSW